MTTDTPAGFNGRQVAQLLAPINPGRVLRDGKGHSHVSQQDVTAHLIRVFGFGGFDVETLELRCLFETPRDDAGKRFDVCYSARVRLIVKDERGREVAHYDDGSTGLAQNQTRGDGHDLAMKSALSVAKKRAAINLGDQFGLSLYNKGQTDALVRGTLARPLLPGETPAEDTEKPTGDVQEGVPQQVALGDHEAPDLDNRGTADEPAERPAERQGGNRQQGRQPAAQGPDTTVVRAHVIAATKARDLDTLRDVWQQAVAAGTFGTSIVDPDAADKDAPQITLGDFLTRKRGELEQAAA